jgi:hypothetical protein
MSAYEEFCGCQEASCKQCFGPDATGASLPSGTPDEGTLRCCGQPEFNPGPWHRVSCPRYAASPFQGGSQEGRLCAVCSECPVVDERVCGACRRAALSPHPPQVKP